MFSSRGRAGHSLAPMLSMARSHAGSLLVPLVLAVLIAILMYFYWGASSELRGLRSKKADLDRDIITARGDRDNLQYQLSLLKQDVETASKKQEELEAGLKTEAEKRVRR